MRQYPLQEIFQLGMTHVGIQYKLVLCPHYFLKVMGQWNHLKSEWDYVVPAHPDLCKLFLFLCLFLSSFSSSRQVAKLCLLMFIIKWWNSIITATLTVWREGHMGKSHKLINMIMQIFTELVPFFMFTCSSWKLIGCFVF